MSKEVFLHGNFVTNRYYWWLT